MGTRARRVRLSMVLLRGWFLRGLSPKRAAAISMATDVNTGCTQSAKQHTSVREGGLGLRGRQQGRGGAGIEGMTAREGGLGLRGRQHGVCKEEQSSEPVTSP